MTAETGSRIAEVGELLALADLTGITTYAISGERHSDGAVHEPQQEMLVAVREEQLGFETRIQLTQTTPEAKLVADIGATYTLERPVTLAPGIMNEFVERVGVMAIFPYLREAVSTTATRIGVPAPIYGLMRQGQVHLTPHSDVVDSDDDADEVVTD